MGQNARGRYGMAHHKVSHHRYPRRAARADADGDSSRTFTRDAKHVHEREQALRLLRSVITLPAPPPASRPSSSRASRKHGSRSRRPSHSRHPSTHDAGNVFVLILAQKIALTDGILRSLVSVAENPDDALRTICMQTLIEIGECGDPGKGDQSTLLTI